MNQYEDIVLMAWARDAQGGSQRFTGERIFQRAGQWGHDRLVRNIPIIVTYHYLMDQKHSTFAMAVVPDAAVPLLVYLRKPDRIDESGGDGVPLSTWLVYDHLEDE